MEGMFQFLIGLTFFSKTCITT